MAKHNPHMETGPGDNDYKPIGTVVAELQPLYPEISASSLRFLERERLVEPHRSPGGHRLYSPADVQRIRLIKEWQARRLSLAEIRNRLDELGQIPSSADLRDRALALYLDGWTREAQILLLAHDPGQLDLATMFGDVLTPILVEVGTRWESGELEVSQEKEISESIREVIVELSIRHRDPESQGPILVAATVRGELHELGLRMICGILGEAGYQVVFLGANAAPEHIGEAVRRHRPAAVLLSTGTTRGLASVQETIDTIAALDLSPAPHLLVGGAGVVGNEDAVRAMGASPVQTFGYTELAAELGRLLAWP